MNLKKIIVGLHLLILLNGCVQGSTLLGPAYTLATTGNVYNAGLSYGGDKIVTKKTGKSVARNIKDIIVPEKKNEQDKEGTDFQKLVKKNIEETRKKLNLSNQ
jgi:hypothetical protein